MPTAKQASKRSLVQTDKIEMPVLKWSDSASAFETTCKPLGHVVNARCRALYAKAVIALWPAALMAFSAGQAAPLCTDETQALDASLTRDFDASRHIYLDG